MDDISVGQIFITASGRELEVKAVTSLSVFYHDLSKPVPFLIRLPHHEFRRVVGI